MSKGPHRWKGGDPRPAMQARLDTILDCVDPRCSLCGACLAAAQGDHVRHERRPPMIAFDDPIRTWRTWAGPRRRSA